MNKILKFKYWILSVSILSVFSIIIGCTAYYFLEQERLIKEAYPYPAIYAAVKKECPALANKNKYENKTTRDNGSLISGVTEFEYQGENQKVDMRIVRNTITIYFIKIKSLEKQDNFEVEDYESALKYDINDKKFYSSNLDIPQPDSNLKKAFEQEVIERLKSC